MDRETAESMTRKGLEAFLREYLSLQSSLEPLTETLSSQPSLCPSVAFGKV